jgi:hypothetical protein
MSFITMNLWTANDAVKEAEERERKQEIEREGERISASSFALKKQRESAASHASAPTSRPKSSSVSPQNATANGKPVPGLARAVVKKSEDQEPFSSRMTANDGLDDQSIILLFENQGQQGGQGGDGESESGDDTLCAASNEQACVAAADMQLACEALADLLFPLSGDSGIFEVEMPNGQKLGVVVNKQAEQVNFLLSPCSIQLGAMLRQRRMELEGHVERRIRRPVKITIL